MTSPAAKPIYLEGSRKQIIEDLRYSIDNGSKAASDARDMLAADIGRDKIIAGHLDILEAALGQMPASFMLDTANAEVASIRKNLCWPLKQS